MKYSRLIIVQIFIIYFFCVQTVFGASDTFRVGLLVGGDTTPPTTPSALLTTPMAQAQINLLWGASTDNFLLGGYQVFRNGLHIATTTLTTYSDSGLTANTLYSYTVRAFDSVFNVSSSSNVSATSTFSVASTTTPPVVVSGGNADGPSRLVSLTFDPTLQSMEVTWSTSQYMQFELRWGRTTSYEIGFVHNDMYTREHSTSITDLLPGTLYEYQLVGYDHNGRKFILKEGQFKTADAPDTQAPLNVFDLTVSKQGTDVLLTWKNPTDLDFKQVRIVRNYLFYPADQSDGFIVYQGDGTSFVDRDALGDSTTKFYSVFTYDEKGNISSGAIIAIRADGVVILNPLMTQEGGTATDTSAGFDDSASTERDTHEGTGLTFDDIEFLQNNDHIYGKKIDIEIPLTVRIAYGKLPEHLKTITVSFTHPNDTEASFSFLLRINKDKTYYEATIAPLRIVGLYPVSVFVFDYTTKKLIALTGSLYAERITTFAHTVTGVKKFVQQLEVVKDRALAPAFAWWWALLAVVGYRIFKILLR